MTTEIQFRDDVPPEVRELFVQREKAYARVLEALQKVLAANDEFRAQLPSGWEGDPLNDACIEAREAIRDLLP